jgi:hypothetical protein
MAKWYFLPQTVPSDGEIVNVRLYNGYADVFQATWSGSDNTFVMSGLHYPFWMIAKWSPLT